ncbi:MAG: sodium:solute symporter family transporter [Pontiellaceae bacterium]
MELSSFGLFNSLILLFYIISLVIIGFIFSKRNKSLDNFFLGNRNLPWLPVAMSIFASVTSATTLIAVPGLIIDQNISFISIGLASLLVAPIIIKIFYSKYHENKITTSYQYLMIRFGSKAQHYTGFLYIFFRLSWLGLVIYAPALALNITTDISIFTCILLIGIISTIYASLGGISAVIWTDVIQFTFLLIGIIWISILLPNQIDGGINTIIETSKISGKFDVMNWSNLTVLSLPIIGIHFFLQLMYDYGTDQITVQRMMATGSQTKTTKAIFFNALADVLIISLLIFIGLGLFTFYSLNSLPENIIGDKILPYYIINELPNGLSGLLITSIFAAAMSSMDSGINTISTVLIKDIPIKLNKNLKVAKIISISIGLIATIIALFISNTENLLIENFYKFMSLLCAPILALFIMGVLTKNSNIKGWLFGLTGSIAITLWIQHKELIHIMYLFTCSFIICLILGITFSYLFKKA